MAHGIDVAPDEMALVVLQEQVVGSKRNYFWGGAAACHLSHPVGLETTAGDGMAALDLALEKKTGSSMTYITNRYMRDRVDKQTDFQSHTLQLGRLIFRLTWGVRGNAGTAERTMTNTGRPIRDLQNQQHSTNPASCQYIDMHEIISVQTQSS